MCANNDVYGTHLQRGEDGFPVGRLGTTREQTHLYGKSFEEAGDRGMMLLREDLRRGHQRALETVIQRDEHAQQADQRFPTAHIALHQAVHLVATAHVLADLLHHALLCTGELEGKMLGIEAVEVVSHGGEHVPTQALLQLEFLLQQL